MTERQLIILQTIVIQVIAKSRFNSSKDCFEQTSPLEIPMELAEFRELANIKTHLDDLLEDISGVVN